MPFISLKPKITILGVTSKPLKPADNPYFKVRTKIGFQKRLVIGRESKWNLTTSQALSLLSNKYLGSSFDINNPFTPVTPLYLVKGIAKKISGWPTFVESRDVELAQSAGVIADYFHQNLSARLSFDQGILKIDGYTLPFYSLNHLSSSLIFEATIKGAPEQEAIKRFFEGIHRKDILKLAQSGIKLDTGMGALIAEEVKDENETFLLSSFKKLFNKDTLDVLLEVFRYASKNKILSVKQAAAKIIKSGPEIKKIAEDDLDEPNKTRLKEIEDFSWGKLAVSLNVLLSRINKGFAMATFLCSKIEVAVYGFIRNGLPNNFQEFLETGHDPKGDTAFFYAVGSHKEIRGLDMGRPQIWEAVRYIAKFSPNVKNFRTLSPITGLRDYLLEVLNETPGKAHALKTNSIVSFMEKETRSALAELSRNRNLSGSDDDEYIKALLINSIQENNWHKDPIIVEALRQILANAIPIYLTERDPKTGKLINLIADLHCGNGAVFSRVNMFIFSRPEDAASMGCQVSYRYTHPDNKEEIKRNIASYEASQILAKIGAGTAEKQ